MKIEMDWIGDYEFEAKEHNTPGQRPSIELYFGDGKTTCSFEMPLYAAEKLLGILAGAIAVAKAKE